MCYYGITHLNPSSSNPSYYIILLAVTVLRELQQYFQLWHQHLADSILCSSSHPVTYKRRVQNLQALPLGARHRVPTAPRASVESCVLPAKEQRRVRQPPPPHTCKDLDIVCHPFLCSKFILKETPWLGGQAVKRKVQTVSLQRVLRAGVCGLTQLRSGLFRETHKLAH